VLEPVAPTHSATATAGADNAAAVQACIRRFADIPENTAGNPTWQRWYRSGSPQVLHAVAEAASEYFHTDEISTEAGVRMGLVAVGADPVRRRAVVLVDPALVEASLLQRELEVAAQREHRANPAEAVLPVAVLPSCFGGPALADARDAIEKEIVHNPTVHHPATSAPGLDSRQPVALGTADHAVGEDLKRRYGPLIRLTYTDSHKVPS
jgi:hypothetical protein